MSAQNRRDFLLRNIKEISQVWRWASKKLFTSVLHCFLDRDCILFTMRWSWHSSTIISHKVEIDTIIKQSLIPEHNPFYFFWFLAVNLVNTFAWIGAIGSSRGLKIEKSLLKIKLQKSVNIGLKFKFLLTFKYFFKKVFNPNNWHSNLKLSTIFCIPCYVGSITVTRIELIFRSPT